MFRIRCFSVVCMFAALPLLGGDNAPRAPRDALQVFNDLIGAWRGTATPVGTREEQQKNWWEEKMNWQWQFKGQDAWLKVDFEKSKNFTSGELRYLADKDMFALTLRTPAKESLTYTGPFKDKVLTVDRQTGGQTHRLVVTLLHDNRFLYRYEVRPAGKALFARQYSVGATREGVPFASGDGKPVCIVSGGLGTMAVAHNGKTYSVCCSGCRDEFRENPEKYVKEFKAKQLEAKQKAKK